MLPLSEFTLKCHTRSLSVSTRVSGDEWLSDKRLGERKDRESTELYRAAVDRAFGATIYRESAHVVIPWSAREKLCGTTVLKLGHAPRFSYD